MELNNDNFWTLHLSSDELRLIVRALRGRFVSPNDEAKAIELSRQISRERARHSKIAHTEADRLLSDIEDSTPEPQP